MLKSTLRLAAALPLLLALVSVPLSPPAEAAIQLEDASGRQVSVRDSRRLVTLGGGITEIVYALKAGKQIVGTDITSMYPTEAARLPKVGQDRRVSAEGVLALNPSLVLASKDAEPSAALDQLRSVGVAVVLVSDEPSLQGARERIRVIARALGLDAEGRKLIATLDRQTNEAKRIAPPGRPPRILFIYARGAGSMNVSGTETAANAMIDLAGARNAVSEFTGYKPFTAEAAIKASPDVLMLTESGARSLGGPQGILKIPGLAQTPAGRNQRVVVMDDQLLLSFGPRTGAALVDLRRDLFGSAKSSMTVKP